MAEKQALTETQVASIVEAGGKRWQRGTMDRIYFNAERFGLKVSYYKSGNVSDATFDGSLVSNAEAYRIMAAKVYVDVKTGEVSCDFGRVRADVREAFEEKVRAVVDAALSAKPEPEQADEAPAEEPAPAAPDGPEGDGAAAMAYAAERAAELGARAEKASGDAARAAEGVRRAESGDPWDYFARRPRSRWVARHPEDETAERALDGWRKMREVAEADAERCAARAEALRAWRPSPWEARPDGSLADGAGDRLVPGAGVWRLYPAGADEGGYVLMDWDRGERMARRADRALVDLLSGVKRPRQ